MDLNKGAVLNLNWSFRARKYFFFLLKRAECGQNNGQDRTSLDIVPSTFVLQVHIT